MSSKGKSSAATSGACALGPKLRFPEFQEANGWRVRKLNSILFEAKHRNRSLELGPADVLSVSGEYGCVNQVEFLGRSYAGVTVKDYHVVEHGDIVYTKSPLKKNPFGIIKENKGKRGIVSTLYAVYRPFPECCPTYLDHFFSVDFHLNSYLQPIVRKGAKNDMKVNNADVLKGEVCVPDLPEQQKIVACLDSADALIAAQGRKVQALRVHKKGLMQQVFPQEGETQPRLRFAEFRDAGEWEEKPLANFIEEYREKSTVQDEFEVMTSARSGLVRQREYYDNDRITERDNVGFNIIPPNYLTYRSRSDDRRFYFNENDLGLTGIVSVYYPVFRIVGGSNKFFVEILSSFARLVGKYSVGTSQTVLSLNQLGQIRLPLPSEAEQQRIADCLTSLDDLITAEARKLETLKSHKKGLMQQLFPPVGEADA
jgi:type I restriction enzyme, S subunit